LKPDACRRVVGRRASSCELRALSELKPRACGSQPPLSRSKGGVAHLVRSFRLMPESISHDWHVQPDCQRPNRRPPERGVRHRPERCRALRHVGGQQSPHHTQIRLSSKPYKHTVWRKRLSMKPATGFPVDFHNGKPPKKSAHATVWSSAQNTTFAHGKAEDEKLRKELFGGPCFEGTLRNCRTHEAKLRVPNQVPWPGQLKATRLLQH